MPCQMKDREDTGKQRAGGGRREEKRLGIVVIGLLPHPFPPPLPPASTQLGCLTFEVLMGHPPFSADDPDQAVECILFEEPDYPAFLSDGAVDFISMVSERLGGRRVAQSPTFLSDAPQVLH